MEFKKEIHQLLNLLKSNGHDRPAIELRLGYSPKGITQSLSRGESLEKLYKLLLLYKDAVLNNATPGSTEYVMNDSGNDEVYGTPIATILQQQNKLMVSLNKQSETSNAILQHLSTEMAVKVNKMDASLTDALGRVDSLKFDLYSGKVVVLQSLARLEGRPVNSLVVEADNIVKGILSGQPHKLGKSAGKGR